MCVCIRWAESNRIAFGSLGGSERMSVDFPLSPPPPPPPLPPPAGPCSPPPTSAPKKKLYQTIASSRSPVEGDYTEACTLISRRESSFRKDLQWILANKYVPSLIQNGPQCGLVALWMAAQLQRPEPSVDMEAVVHTATSRGYTAQGEMFSASNMALLAEEVCGCKAELLSGGLTGENGTTMVGHLWGGQPVLIPYDEDCNHEPCQRGGHRAHWAVASGVLLGLDPGSVSPEHAQPNATLPWLCLAPDGCPPPPIGSTAVREVYILAKQGKSLRYQLWSLDAVAQSNEQLRTMDPQRANDGTRYVVPQGGMEAGLAGQVVLLHTRTLTRQED
ncbi:actin maturation protease [Menidia menidia]